MVLKVFTKEDFTSDEQLNLIVSNLVLGQTMPFTYDSILKDASELFGTYVASVETTLKRCLVRLLDDGSIRLFGCHYTVVSSIL